MIYSTTMRVGSTFVTVIYTAASLQSQTNDNVGVSTSVEGGAIASAAATDVRWGILGSSSQSAQDVSPSSAQSTISSVTISTSTVSQTEAPSSRSSDMVTTSTILQTEKSTSQLSDRSTTSISIPVPKSTSVAVITTSHTSLGPFLTISGSNPISTSVSTPAAPLDGTDLLPAFRIGLIGGMVLMGASVIGACVWLTWYRRSKTSDTIKQEDSKSGQDVSGQESGVVYRQTWFSRRTQRASDRHISSYGSTASRSLLGQ